MAKRAFITGVTGQDGSYLVEFLLDKGYEVHGLVRRTSSIARDRIDRVRAGRDDLDGRFFLHYGDITDGAHLMGLVADVAPDEVYHLAAQSHVKVSFDQPVFSVEVDAVGTLNVLEAVRRMATPARFYQASSSEMYGQAEEVPQTERTPFHPRSPYACAKVYSYWQTRNYREAYGLFATNGILFNHESPRRGETFVTRKVTLAAARIKLGLQDRLLLGNLDAKRDWGFAGDYVDAMWRMLQHDRADDYVIATGETHSIRELLDEAFTHVGLDWNDYVEVDPRYQRPAEVELLLGDATKAREELGWEPRVTFRGLVQMMVDADLDEVGRDAATSGRTES